MQSSVKTNGDLLYFEKWTKYQIELELVCLFSLTSV
jgi:hypothetical protein